MTTDVYIFGAHVRQGYTAKISAFRDLLNEGQGRGPEKESIEKLLNAKKLRWVQADCPFFDDIGFKRPLNAFAEVRRIGRKAAADRLCLMNDEVMFQFRTGSPLTYRFESISLAEAFFRYVLLEKLPHVKVHHSPALPPFKIGDKVQLLEDIAVNTGWTYKAGDIVRVYNIEYDSGVFVPSGEDGKTFVRVSGTGGAKIHIGFTYIPFSKAVLIKQA